MSGGNSRARSLGLKGGNVLSPGRTRRRARRKATRRQQRATRRKHR